MAVAYPMPRIDKLMDRLWKSHYITTIDPTRGYLAGTRYRTGQTQNGFRNRLWFIPV